MTLTGRSADICANVPIRTRPSYVKHKMDWVEESKRIFRAGKPEYFANFMHCEECADHDETLRSMDLENIGMDHLGNPGWNPMCFCSVDGMKYYMPAMIRLCVDTLCTSDTYLAQFLFHLESDGEDNALVKACSREQRVFIASFVEYLLEKHAREIGDNYCTDNALRVHEIWSKV